MNNFVQKNPFIVGENEYAKLERIPLSNGEFKEVWMQSLLQNAPGLLPVRGINPKYYPLVCIGREVVTNAGRIDNLYISPNGYITIVETKLWRNPWARREAVIQIIDYAKEVQQFSYENLDEIVRAFNRRYNNEECGLFETMVKYKHLDYTDEAFFVDSVKKNLSNARFLLLIVGDGIQEGVSELTDFLNSTPNMLYDLALVELEVYRLPEEKRLVIPKLLMKTEIVERMAFRFEDGKIFVEQARDQDDKPQKTSMRGISKDDFIDLLLENNPEISKRNINAFFDNLSDLGYDILSSGKRDIRIKCPIPGGRSINVMYFSADNKGYAYKHKGTLKNDLVKYNYSGEIASAFYERLKTYEIESHESSIDIRHDFPKMLENLDDVINIFEMFRNYL
ncbi:MAG: hypothetical protein GX363_10005 [Clostridiales bacterium]|jgi:hypothetical protein|nr:hypothetical protein [Clostridiales bacterium]